MRILITGGAGFTNPVNLGNPVEMTMLELAEIVKTIIDNRGLKSKRG